MGPGVARPGSVVQTLMMTTASVTSGTLNTYQSTAISQAITPTASPNLVRYSFSTTAYNRAITNTVTMFVAMHNGSTQIGGIYGIWGQTQQGNAGLAETFYDAPGSTSSQTYVLKFKNSDNTTNMSVPTTASDNATLTVEEIQG